MMRTLALVPASIRLSYWQVNPHNSRVLRMGIPLNHPVPFAGVASPRLPAPRQFVDAEQPAALALPHRLPRMVLPSITSLCNPSFVTPSILRAWMGVVLKT